MRIINYNAILFKHNKNVAKSELTYELEKIIQQFVNKGVNAFIFCNSGNFIKICYSILKTSYPKIIIEKYVDYDCSLESEASKNKFDQLDTYIVQKKKVIKNHNLFVFSETNKISQNQSNKICFQIYNVNNTCMCCYNIIDKH